MKREISFTKMSGAGNDFVVIDNLDGKIEFDKSQLVIALCSRRYGVGADGLLLLERSGSADFFMRYYNADGSYGGMCGNGGRCVARFACITGIAKQRMKFEALDFVYEAEVTNASVKLWMRVPTSLRPNILVTLDGEEFSGHFVDTGSPHFVIECSDLASADVVHFGRAIRRHPVFGADGCNVNFVSRQEDGSVGIRTFERGVEAETLACGTGAVASAIMLALQHGLQSPVRLNVRSGEQLTVYFELDGGKFRNVILEGSAHIIFSGTLLYDPETGSITDTVKTVSTENL